MRRLAQRAMDEAARLRASYADARFEELQAEAVQVKNGSVEGIERGASSGFGVRVMVEGSWGFSSSHERTPNSVEEVTRRAVSLAKAAARTRRRDVELDDTSLASTSFATPVRRDPFEVSIAEKAGLLQECHRRMSRVRGIFQSEGVLRAWKKKQLLQILGRPPIEQTIVECGGGISCFSVRGSEMQRRSYPAAHGGNYATAGYEYIEELKLPENAEAIAREAVALLKAPPCPEGEFPLVIETSQLALQVHESVGHPTELDRIFGTEISFAGGSWVKPEDVGRVTYGSPVMNVVGDATLPRGLGSFGFDDEGVPARKFFLVKEGVLQDALSSRETAPRIGRRSTGAMRADGWNRLPLVRMTNVSLEGGDGSFEELISGVRRGIYVAVNKSWSIDDRRLNFQFATEVAREIKHGKLGRLLRNPIYQGMGPEFWAMLDGVDRNVVHWGIPNCGKGQPMQTAHVGHSAPNGLFRKVKVGCAK